MKHKAVLFLTVAISASRNRPVCETEAWKRHLHWKKQTGAILCPQRDSWHQQPKPASLWNPLSENVLLPSCSNLFANSLSTYHCWNNALHWWVTLWYDNHGFTDFNVGHVHALPEYCCFSASNSVSQDDRCLASIWSHDAFRCVPLWSFLSAHQAKNGVQQHWQ